MMKFTDPCKGYDGSVVSAKNESCKDLPIGMAPAPWVCKVDWSKSSHRDGIGSATVHKWSEEYSPSRFVAKDGSTMSSYV